MIGEFLKPVKRQEANYEYMSMSDRTDHIAKIWFERPPYHLFECMSWTTRREEYDAEFARQFAGRFEELGRESECANGGTEDFCSTVS